MGTTVHTYTVARVLHRSKLFGDGDEEKPLLEKAQMKSGLDINQRCVGDSKVSWKKVPLSNQKKKQLSNSVCKKMKSKAPQKWLRDNKVNVLERWNDHFITKSHTVTVSIQKPLK